MGWRVDHDEGRLCFCGINLGLAAGGAVDDLRGRVGAPCAIDGRGAPGISVDDECDGASVGGGGKIDRA
jgi:hypothetical protein